MRIIKTVSEMQTAALELKHPGKRLGLVPTMGYLHQGHISLLDALRDRCDVLIVSIFVNPAQFGPGEDLDKYPQNIDRDRRILWENACDILFYPSADEMYPGDYSTYVAVGRMTEALCGRSRPGHFRGVATVVAKLFNITRCDAAAFGQKDGQQAAVVRRMVQDLNFPVEIIVAPTVREADGLAMSSRNKYLTQKERRNAPCLKKALDMAEHMVSEGEQDAVIILRSMRQFLELVEGAEIEYIEAVEADTIQPVERIDRRTMFALAVKFGAARLIDNAVVSPTA